MKNQKGITLIALVITIIIMGILATTLIYNGIEALDNAKVQAFLSEIQLVQSKVNEYVAKNPSSTSIIASRDIVVNEPGSATTNVATDIVKGDTLTFNNTATGNTGTILVYTVPNNIEVEIEAWGAAGCQGNPNSGGTITPTGGKGAYIKTDTVTLNQGDELVILVGQQGTLEPLVVNADGSGGGGGGGTYIAKVVPSSSHYLTAQGLNLYIEPLVVVAGGNGGGDARYNTTNGANALATNGSTTTGWTAFLTTPTGGTYTRGSQTGKGGFGCGKVNDDTPGPGGGYTLGTTDATGGAYSYYAGTGVRENGVNEGHGKVVITCTNSDNAPSTQIAVDIGIEISSLTDEDTISKIETIASILAVDTDEYRYFNKENLKTDLGVEKTNFTEFIINFNTRDVISLDGIVITREDGTKERVYREQDIPRRNV